jgi:L-iditol 2-dehydrogenase
MKNRIARLVKIKKIKIFEEELPELKDGEILVKIKAVGICGSDMHYFLEGGLGSFKQELPMDLGHEPAGEVVESFKGSKFKKGDRVAIEPGRACLTCEWCLRGRHNLCEKGIFMVTNSQGAFADYVIVHEVQLARIPNKMSFEKASLMEPLGVALHAIKMIEANPLQNAAVIGSGPIGLSIMFVLKKMGFKEIFMVDKLPYRVKFAKKMNGLRTFHFNEAKEKIKKITNGKGVRYVFDTGGTKDSVNLGIDIISISGSLAMVGIPTEDYIEINPHKARTKEIKIQNVRRSNQTLEDSIRMFEDDKDVEKMITHKFELKDIQKAFDMVGKYKNNVVKCVIYNK